MLFCLMVWMAFVIYLMELIEFFICKLDVHGVF